MTNHINLDQDFGLGLFFDVALFRLYLTADEKANEYNTALGMCLILQSIKNCKTGEYTGLNHIF